MGRRGKIAWKSAVEYVTRTLYSRTSSGVPTLTDLLDLPVTLRNVSKPVKLAVVTSLRFTQGKLIRLVQTGHAILPLLRSHPLFRNQICKLESMVNLLKMYRALLHSDKKDWEGGGGEGMRPISEKIVPVNLLTNKSERRFLFLIVSGQGSFQFQDSFPFAEKLTVLVLCLSLVRFLKLHGTLTRGFPDFWQDCLDN